MERPAGAAVAAAGQRRRSSRASTCAGCRPASARTIRMIPTSDILFFRAEDKYTRVQTARVRGADPQADQGADRRARPGRILADPPRHRGSRRRDRAGQPQSSRQPGRAREGQRRKARSEPHVQPSVQADVARATTRCGPASPIGRNGCDGMVVRAFPFAWLWMYATDALPAAGPAPAIFKRCRCREALVANIQDVSPTVSNTTFDSSFNFATGRMLSLRKRGRWQARVRGLLLQQCVACRKTAATRGRKSTGRSRPRDSSVCPARSAARAFPIVVGRAGLAPLVSSVAIPVCRGHHRERPRFIVGFGDTGVWTALCARLTARSSAPRWCSSDFG